MSKGEAEIPKLIAEMITEHHLVLGAFCKAFSYRSSNTWDVYLRCIPEMKRLALTSSNRVAPRRFTTSSNLFHQTLDKLWWKYKNVFIFGFFWTSRRHHLLCFGRKAAKVLTSIQLPCHEQWIHESDRGLVDSVGLVIASKVELMKKTIKLELGISDHNLIYGCLQTKLRFNPLKFIRDMENAPWSVCSVFDDPDDSYWAWVTIFKDIETVTGTHREDKWR